MGDEPITLFGFPVVVTDAITDKGRRFGSLDDLYPKYKCPKCGDWFHMPYKFCKCPRVEGEQQSKA